MYFYFAAKEVKAQKLRKFLKVKKLNISKGIFI
jgi:hypothetical protein